MNGPSVEGCLQGYCELEQTVTKITNCYPPSFSGKQWGQGHTASNQTRKQRREGGVCQMLRFLSDLEAGKIISGMPSCVLVGQGDSGREAESSILIPVLCRLLTRMSGKLQC